MINFKFLIYGYQKKKKKVSRPEGEELAREKVGGKRLKSTGRKASGEEKTTF